MNRRSKKQPKIKVPRNYRRAIESLDARLEENAPESYAEKLILMRLHMFGEIPRAREQALADLEKLYANGQMD